MKLALRILFVAIEINLILWLVGLGILLASDAVSALAKKWVVVGTLFAAVIQHWAFYAVYRTANRLSESHQPPGPSKEG